MGITKTAPNHFFIKARAKVRVKVQTADGVRIVLEDRRKQEQFRGARSEAETRYLEMRRELRGEKAPARTFGDLLDAYEAIRDLKGSQAYMARRLREDLGLVDLRELPDALARFHFLLKSQPSKSTGRRIGGSTLNRFRTMLGTVLNQAVAAKVLAENPLTEAIWPWAPESPRDRFLDPIEERRLMAALEQRAPHLVALVRFALLVPCRKSELTRMTPADLDLFNNAIRVHNGTTKNDVGSWKPIPPEMLSYFRTLPPETPFLFFRMHKGRPVGLGDFKRAWRTAKRLAGIQDLHFHDTRHVSATNLVDAGTPERVVMKVAGWKTNMLSTYYSSSSRKALSLVKFPTGRGNDGATSGEDAGKSGVSEAERAVS